MNTNTDNTVRILCVGDPHYTSNNQRETDALEAELCRVIQDEQVSTVIILGDTLDRHETVNLNVLHRVKKLFFSLVNLNVTLYVLIGNHDIPNNKLFMSEVHPFMLMNHPNIHIIDKVTTITINNANFLLVPYVPPGRFEEAVKDHLDNITCIFAHQEFKGACYNGISSNEGDMWNHPIDIISGHIHERQQLGRIYYPGTPYQTNLGEKPDKTISLFEWKDRRYEKLIHLNIPKKITIDIDTIAIRAWQPPDTINRYRLNVHGTNAEFITLTKTGIIKALTNKGVKVVFKETGTKTIITTREKTSFLQGVMTIINEQDPSIRDPLLQLSKELFGIV